MLKLVEPLQLAQSWSRHLGWNASRSHVMRFSNLFRDMYCCSNSQVNPHKKPIWLWEKLKTYCILHLFSFPFTKWTFWMNNIQSFKFFVLKTPFFLLDSTALGLLFMLELDMQRRLKKLFNVYHYNKGYFTEHSGRQQFFGKCA